MVPRGFTAVMTLLPGFRESPGDWPWVGSSFTLPTAKHQPFRVHQCVPVCCHQDLCSHDDSITVMYFHWKVDQPPCVKASGHVLSDLLPEKTEQAPEREAAVKGRLAQTGI